MSSIGKRIKDLRRKSGKSQEELGYEVNVSRQTVSKWEIGTMQPTAENIIALCDFFNVTSEYLLGGETAAESDAVATDAAEENSQRQTKPKRKNLLFIGLIALSSVLFALGAFITCITVILSNEEPIGYDVVQVFHVDEIVLIVGIALAAVSLALIVLFTVLLIRKNKR
ncbi:MAG: helix-turn-helix domain-containing protein [Corallococcus sp.]|nr:helix-turn-helix domain-containing protein [Corallococcus sp.]